ncbi:MAG: bifunctional UDP-N-acetylglucosamine diphosphorylase/glucosamine-1-phosphate N-acetyltransferase GlmU [Epsilonproteobacteria bacterium]|nr:bifunctional UDP-N-acetylglucosamine diphosphorylase/glucosamine-1-phosphate N-acetyltransferase GlmU [Campylobacterota bacterium]
MTSVIIMAAGAGTRMKSTTPKVLHKISGKEMLYYSINEAAKLSNDIEVVVYHQKDRVIQAMRKYFSDIRFITQEHSKFPGTGGAVKCCSPKHNKVFILNGDMPLVSADELRKFENIDADIVMSVIHLDDPDGYGRVVIQNNEVIKIIEQKDATEEEKQIKFVNAGVYLINKEILEKFLPLLDNNNASKEYYLTDIIDLAKKAGKTIKAIEVKEENFKGVNTKYDLANAERIHQNRIKQKLMRNGVIMHLPETIFIENDVKLIGECEIESGCVLKGNSIIDHSLIKANSIIEDAKITNSEIGPMARIRPDSEIIDSKIGNFVEIKKSALNNVKAGHLSYLGDSEIDSGTNIGAGTITCNYDGKNKYKTIIGKNVFIGSDSQLVAPLTIEDDTMIAAGSTITKNVKKGELAISRTPQKTIKNFFYKFFKKEG